jgi:hypothetical protein
MSEAALTQFEQARKEQLDHNEARNMRKNVNQARGDIHGAGARWPFELTQNAHDAGARDGKPDVDIDLAFDGQTVLYEHDGKPFTMQDLAALLSGGSSKEFESTETTGRFGTGFLVTHVLSLQISFTGVLAAEDGPEEVSIRLDRAGDENDIFKNTTHCYQAIQAASKLTALDGHKTARFQYRTDNPEAAQVGIDAFCSTLPYLYGTCEHLGTVRVRDGAGTSWRFEPEAAAEREFMGFYLRVRRFILTQGDGMSRTLSAVRLRRRHDSSSSLVAVTEHAGDRCKLQVPPDGFPRVFCRFPVRASDFLPINAVIDGRFDLRQERDRVLMKDSDREQIAEALGLLPVLVQLALHEAWVDGYSLARVGMPDRAFGEKLDGQKELRDWWRKNLSSIAHTMAAMPLIETSTGFMKASGATSHATFVVPRFALEGPRNELDFGSVWEVASEVRDVHPPSRDIASDWASIASGWVELGVQVRQMALAQIADAVRRESTELAELKVTTEPLPWLARFLNLVGEVAGQHNCAAILSNLLPNQNKKLKSPSSLWRDMGIKEDLKDIALAVGRDVRGRLLLEDLAGFYLDPALPNLEGLLDAQVTQTLGESTVVNECIEELNKQLPDNKPIASEKLKYGQASIDLLKYLWESQGVDAMQVGQQCPLVASDNSAIRWTVQRKALAPVSVWHASAQPFAKLYESDRILAEDYVTRAAGTLTLVNALVKWDIAFADPLCTDAPRELRGERLHAITVEGEDSTNVTVVDVPLSQIALLPNQLIQRCQNDEDLARLLLGLTLTHISVNDPSWRNAREVPARRDRADTKIKVLPALWLADLRSKAWVPVRSEKDGQQVVQPVVADAGNLRPLLDPGWLAGNDVAVELLSRFFGFNALELRLLSTVPSEADRSQVENELAKIVQVLGGDPGKYGQLAAGLVAQQEREKQREKNRRFGLAVQKAIERYLDKRGLHPEFIDRGYDYDLFLEAPALDAGTHHFKLADYLLEVKATTTGEVRLTPAQAQTASEQLDRFILCVVDLRGVVPEQLEGDWTPADVEPRARIVVQIGSLAGESHDLVEWAKSCEVGIRNDAALRYGVPVAIWKAGSALAEWVDSLPLAPSAGSGDTP